MSIQFRFRRLVLEAAIPLEEDKSDLAEELGFYLDEILKKKFKKSDRDFYYGCA